MTVVRISDNALASGASQVERELVQLSILQKLNPSDDLALSPLHNNGVAMLARWRGIPLSSDNDGETTPIDSLWNNRLRVTVIVACHNYGHYLDEAIRSVLNQSYLPDEIILSDDASNDDSAEIMKSYERKYPGLIRVNINEENQGIQSHFNHVVGMSTGELVAIIGADNRVPASYIEAQLAVLALDDSVGIAYTDFALFGGRAKHDYDRMRADFRGERLPNGVYLSNFPEYSEETAKLLREGINFIHGSSMYRKTAWEQVGGYASREEKPEDMSLFQSILATGVSAQKVSSAVLEYRQHSSEQANYQFSYFGELQRLREESKSHRAQLQAQGEALIAAGKAEIAAAKALQASQEKIQEYAAALEEIQNSSSFKLGNKIVKPLSRLLKGKSK